MAKRALRKSQVMNSRATRIEAEIRTIQRENHLGPNVHRALKGG